ncbi:MAG: hypothetical protein NC131_01160 [Roseburia sp.]|nr:hypothetical protein [Roseburia sp.]
MPQYGDTTRFMIYAQRLWELENQLESGKLIGLPCKVGDTVYGLYQPFVVTEITIKECGIFIEVSEKNC